MITQTFICSYCKYPNNIEIEEDNRYGERLRQLVDNCLNKYHYIYKRIGPVQLRFEYNLISMEPYTKAHFYSCANCDKDLYSILPLDEIDFMYNKKKLDEDRELMDSIILDILKVELEAENGNV